MRSTSELIQLEIATSTRRYLPPKGTAGLERCCVSGKRRVPAPPPRITASSLRLEGISPFRYLGLNFRQQNRLKGALLSRITTEPFAVAKGSETQPALAPLNHRTICGSQWIVDSTNSCTLNRRTICGSQWIGNSTCSSTAQPQNHLR